MYLSIKMWVNSNFRRERGTIALIAAVRGESKEVFKMILKQVEMTKAKKDLNISSSAGC